MTRLGDVTGLGGMGVPTFQAVRPWSRSLSVSQGKGLTAMAAMTSALLEAVEQDAAERLEAPAATPEPLASRPGPDRLAWRDASRDPLAIRLDPDIPRRWATGVDLATNRPAAIPFDLLSLDFTAPPSPDLLRSTLGLATGNSRAEALEGALAELVEHHLAVRLDRLSPAERRAAQLDIESVDAPLARALLRRIAAHDFAARIWSLGHEAGVSAFWCAIYPESGRSGGMAPASGSGCHPSRETALLRALLEAAQTRATLVAGARDDLSPALYRDGERRQLDLLLGSLAFGPGPLAWADVPDRSQASAEDELALLLETAGTLSPLPVLAFDHPQPHPALHIVRAVAPGLAARDRDAAGRRVACPAAPAIGRRRPRRPVLFAGPSLFAAEVGLGVELRPPAICGDLLALLDDPPPAVGLIDGCFETAPTVWHKEVLELLAAGVRVVGGSSLGAIRAAELGRFGMEGVGAIHAAYLSGAIRRDDAVMLAHAPAELGYRPLTLSLVDAEAALLATAMPPAERRALQRAARTLPYAVRTWPLCFERTARVTGRAPSTPEATLAAAPSLKRRDALLVTGALLERPAAPTPARDPPPRTRFLRRLFAATASPAPTASRP